MTLRKFLAFVGFVAMATSAPATVTEGVAQDYLGQASTSFQLFGPAPGFSQTFSLAFLGGSGFSWYISQIAYLYTIGPSGEEFDELYYNCDASFDYCGGYFSPDDSTFTITLDTAPQEPASPDGTIGISEPNSLSLQVSALTDRPVPYRLTVNDPAPPVPELGTWAMTILGFGLFAAMLRRARDLGKISPAALR